LTCCASNAVCSTVTDFWTLNVASRNATFFRARLPASNRNSTRRSGLAPGSASNAAAYNSSSVG
jgi:hypothetical protein